MGSLVNIVDTLNAKFDYFEHQFKNFQTNTNISIEALYNKGETGVSKQKDLEIHRLQEENRKLHSDNTDLTKRLNDRFD